MLRNADYIYNKIVVADNNSTTKQYCKKAQVGVDLSVKSIEKMTAGCTLCSKTYAAETTPLNMDTLTFKGVTFTGWFIPKGTYILKLNEGCSFGPNDTGLIILRSSLNRSGVSISSAVWDPGYRSIDEDGTIYPMSIRLTVDNPEGFYLEKNARVAQLIVFDNEDTDLYDGQWQGGKTVSKLVK